MTSKCGIIQSWWVSETETETTIALQTTVVSGVGGEGCQHLEEGFRDRDGPQDDRGQGEHLQHGGGGRIRADEDKQGVAGQGGEGVQLQDGGGGHEGLLTGPGREEVLQAGGTSVGVNPEDHSSAEPTHSQELDR